MEEEKKPRCIIREQLELIEWLKDLQQKTTEGGAERYERGIIRIRQRVKGLIRYRNWLKENRLI